MVVREKTPQADHGARNTTDFERCLQRAQKTTILTMSDTLTLFNPSIYDEYDKRFGTPANAPHVGHTCRECANRQRWQADHSNTVQQYCAARRSRRTRNGLLKIKCNQAACCLFKPDAENETNRTD